MSWQEYPVTFMETRKRGYALSTRSSAYGERALTSLDDFAHDFSHQWLRLVGSSLHLFMRNFCGLSLYAQVGYDAHSKHLDATVTGHDDFWYGAHSNSVTP